MAKRLFNEATSP